MAYLDRTILAVVPARGGSKGIARKNLLKLGGLSLVARAGLVVESLPWIDHAIVSTDDHDIQKEGIRSGLDAPFLRPKELSGDYAAVIDVWQHALIESEKKFATIFDVSILLEPTSPFRTPKQVESTVSKLIRGEYDSVLTVSPTDSKQHPLKQLVINEDKIKHYDQLGKTITARQQLENVYHRNGAAYAITRQCLLGYGSITTNKSSFIVISEPIVNIDTKWDFFG